MNIEIKEENGHVRALLAGRLDTVASVEAAPQFKELNDKADMEVILDFASLEYISSSGLRLLIGLRKASESKGGHLVIEHINDAIRNVFVMTGFLNLFDIKD